MSEENGQGDNIILSTPDIHNTDANNESQESSVSEDISESDIIEQLKSDKIALEKRVVDKEKWISHQQRQYSQLENKLNSESVSAKNSVKEQQPDYDDYGSKSEYVDAILQWDKSNNKSVEDIVRQQMQSAEMEKEDQLSRESFEKKSNDIRKMVDDFDEIAKSENINNIYVNSSNNLAAIIQEHPEGPEIAYYLGKNLDVAGKLSKMSVSKLVSTLASLSSQVKVKTKNISSAPQPIVPGKASTSKSTTNPNDIGDMKEYMRWHNRDR